MGSKIDTELFCLHCDKECAHTITYAGQYLSRVRCKECGTEIELDRTRIMENYATETLERILTKPIRVTEEMRKDLTAFLASVPIRIMTKPYRMAKEIMDVIGEDPESKSE